MQARRSPLWYVFWCFLGATQGVLSVATRLAWFPFLFTAYGIPTEGPHFVGLVLLLLVEFVAGGLVGLGIATYTTLPFPHRPYQLLSLACSSLTVGFMLYTTVTLLGYQPPFALIAFPGIAEIGAAVLTYSLVLRLQRNARAFLPFVFRVSAGCTSLIALAVFLGQPPVGELDTIRTNISREIPLREIACRETPDLSARDGRCFTYRNTRSALFRIRKLFEGTFLDRYQFTSIAWLPNQTRLHYVDTAGKWKLIVLAGRYPELTNEPERPQTQNMGYLRILHRRVEMLNPQLQRTTP